MQLRAELFMQGGSFYDAGIFWDFPGKKQKLSLNPVPGKDDMIIIYDLGATSWIVKAKVHGDNDGTPISCSKSASFIPLFEHCLDNWGQFYEARVGGYNNLGGFQAQIAAESADGNNGFGKSYKQGFFYQHGMNHLPTWVRIYNQTTSEYHSWNFYDAGDLKGEDTVFQLPDICNNAPLVHDISEYQKLMMF